jgi:alpha-galactosidase
MNPPARFLRWALIALLFPGLVPVATRAAPAASGIQGAWRIDLPKPYGVTLSTFLILRGDNARIEGSVFPNNAVEIPITGARMEGPDAVFRIDWGWTFHVRPEGDKLRVLIVYDGGGRQEAVALRVPETALGVPAAVPPPPVKDLPYNGLARTPPMGWNSWNHFAESVDDKVVRKNADAMVASGMAAAGYVYVNIDDTWEGGRDADGNVVPNRKFPDMKALADYVHSKGLKFGIYSSPGFVTCGGYEGSYGHEEQDARTYAAWGVDYLKYDWCSAARVYTDGELRPVYQKMGEALQRCGRPIVYSLCEYGMGDVWTWGPGAGGNLWRTTGDIQDNWASFEKIGFNQARLAPYAAPGHWNDPDMLQVGNGGMNPVEYRTHFSLWCMLAAPLMAGNDLRTMSDATRETLTNREAIAVDQDAKGAQGTRLFARDGVEVWSKPLQGGAQAVGLFNRNASGATGAFTWEQIGRQSKPGALRDLWLHRDIAPADEGFSGPIPGHGVILLLVK